MIMTGTATRRDELFCGFVCWLPALLVSLSRVTKIKRRMEEDVVVVVVVVVKIILSLTKIKSDGRFSCPVCEVKANPGKNAELTACDDKIRNVICIEEDPVCVLYKTFSGSQVAFIDRYCLSRNDYNREKDDCDAISIIMFRGNVRYIRLQSLADHFRYCDKTIMKTMKYLVICVFAACTTFGLVQSNEEQPDEPFRCPACTIEGRDAQLQSCDNNIKDEICREEDPVCMLGQLLEGSPFRFKRSCYSREDYEDVKASCEADDPTECVVAMCDTSGCKA
ncbi:hypothetical protein OS493_030929 [Desmophyllum pertusum]|uniref:Uncharacterized protein n=1 Tax=Desmophyllum pertusum TaxID=174260 RepID=A0A9X0A0S4_9CNID|nr:hypothetical protein OS493_030929 [Desmophyllum pertusum]